MIRIAAAALFSKSLAKWPAALGLDKGVITRSLLAVFGCALGFASFCLSKCPSHRIAPDESGHPLRALRFVRQDQLFRRTLICWMFMGFANLMMLPLRVEYLANPNYGQALTVGMIALLTGVIQMSRDFYGVRFEDTLFDHMNFFALRVTLNIGFAIGILAFFKSNTLAWHDLRRSSLLDFECRGDVAWSLWVTKFTPAARVADCMSVHTFLTGVRG